LITPSNPPLARWHKIVENRDLTDLRAMLSENVVFRSPYSWDPFIGREAALRILTTVAEVFQDFTYHRKIIEGANWALEFSARVGDQPVKGIDLIRLNDDHQIIEFEVFVRPVNGLRALGWEMVRRLGGSQA
jgi:RimJ/RimL family protein N-acetyltransferase